MSEPESIIMKHSEYERARPYVYYDREEARLIENVITAATECDTWFRAGGLLGGVTYEAMMASVEAAHRLQDALKALREFREHHDPL